MLHAFEGTLWSILILIAAIGMIHWPEYFMIAVFDGDDRKRELRTIRLGGVSLAAIALASLFYFAF
jgi:hypothetical protein